MCGLRYISSTIAGLALYFVWLSCQQSTRGCVGPSQVVNAISRQQYLFTRGRQ